MTTCCAPLCDKSVVGRIRVGEDRDLRLGGDFFYIAPIVPKPKWSHPCSEKQQQPKSFCNVYVFFKEHTLCNS
jgi:hypothetical protein